MTVVEPTSGRVAREVEKTTSPEKYPVYGLTAAGVLVAFVVIAVYYALRAAPNADEGFYVATAQATSEGLRPYIDFPYTQGPVLPYFYGWILQMIGFGVAELRFLHVAFAVATLLLILHWLRRHGAEWYAMLIGTLPWIASTPAIYFSIVGKSYAFAQLSLLLAAASLQSQKPLWARFTWLAFWGSASVGTRLTMGPAVLVLWVGLLSLSRQSIPLVAALGLPALCAGALFLPFFLTAPQNTYFWLWHYHQQMGLTKNWQGSLVESLVLFPGVALLGLGAVATLGRQSLRPWHWWLAAGLFGWLLNVAMSGVYGEYATPFLPLVVLGATLTLAPTLQAQRNAASARFAPFGALMTLALAAIVPHLGLSSIRGYQPWIRPGYLAAIDNASIALRAHTAPDDLVFSSMPEIPVAAGRRIPPPFRMGKFGMTAEMNLPVAHQLHLITFPELVHSVAHAHPTAVVLSTGREWSFKMSVPRIALLSDDVYDELVKPLIANYTLVYSDDFFLVLVRNEPVPNPKPRPPT